MFLGSSSPDLQPELPSIRKTITDDTDRLEMPGETETEIQDAFYQGKEALDVEWARKR